MPWNRKVRALQAEVERLNAEVGHLNRLVERERGRARDNQEEFLLARQQRDNARNLAILFIANSLAQYSQADVLQFIATVAGTAGVAMTHGFAAEADEMITVAAPVATKLIRKQERKAQSNGSAVVTGNNPDEIAADLRRQGAPDWVINGLVQVMTGKVPGNGQAGEARGI